VIAGLSHDTAAAVAAVPAEGEHWAYLSSGTWSLLGMELDGPVINEKSRDLNFTNEQGIGRTTRFLKNMTGLFMVQECRRTWAEEGRRFSYPALTRLAAQARPFLALVDPSDGRFGKPGNMPEIIRRYCRETGQSVPQTPGQVIRCVLESLALNYRSVMEGMIEVTGRRVDVIHIVGGGSRNRLLNQFAANATGRKVQAGPVEATAAGNILVQAMALGQVRSLAESRAIVRRSFPLKSFIPRDACEWDRAFQKFKKLK
jgi:rhamnulokinase